jgi:TolB-like protein/class 3 adenylate cyclase/Flp pilus assembly protein TadD
MSANAEQRRLAAIMFTDMVGYSTLAQRDDQLALELLEEHRGLLREIFPRFNGTEIKTIGDAFLIEFQSALEAAQCAIEIQRTLAKRNHDVTADRRIELKIGIHIGDVVHRGGDVYGDGVNIASRIEPLAGAGGICVSMDVERQIRNALEARFEKLAPTELKNISVAMDLFRIVLPWEQRTKAEPAEASVSGRSFPALRLLWVGAIILALVGAGWWFAHQSGRQVVSPPSVSSSRAAPATDQKSIAVLPFVNLSADKNDEYLSDGMTEELLNVLTKVKGLRVPGRSASFAFKGRNEDDIFRKVGEQLHVHAVLEGSVRKAGDKLRITAQLINVADGFHLWSETYDRDMKDILAVQSDVAQRVVQALQLQLGVEETQALAKKPTENAEAYRLYLLGRYHFNKFTRAGWSNAIHYFEQALQVDPAYPLAYCGLADTYGWAGGQIVPGREAWPKEKELALKALALDPNLADAHLSLGVALFSAMDFHGSEQELKRAIQLNPNLALAYDQYGWTFMASGHFDEAIALEKKALELDPLNSLLNSDLGFFYHWARRYDEGIAQLRKTLEMDTNNPLARQTLGWCLHWKGKTAEALPEFQKAAALDDLPWYKGSLGYAYAASGDRAKAEQILRDLDEIAKKQYVSPAARASVYLGLGEKAKALDWIEKAGQDRDPLLWWNADQLYDSVRNEPRFKAMMQKIAAGKE